MTALVWILPTLGYVVAAVWLWRRFAWRVALKESANWSHRGRIDNGNVAIGIFLGGVQAFVWPVTLIVMHGGRTSNFYGFLREPSDLRRKRESAEQARRIEQLEREVGIR